MPADLSFMSTRAASPVVGSRQSLCPVQQDIGHCHRCCCMDPAGLGAHPYQLAKATTMQSDGRWFPLCHTQYWGSCPQQNLQLFRSTLEPFPKVSPQHWGGCLEEVLVLCLEPRLHSLASWKPSVLPPKPPSTSLFTTLLLKRPLGSWTLVLIVFCFSVCLFLYTRCCLRSSTAWEPKAPMKGSLLHGLSPDPTSVTNYVLMVWQRNAGLTIPYSSL